MFIAAPHVRSAEFSDVRAARAFALLAMAMHDAAVGCWETKFFYYNPRPSQLDPELKTLIGLPNFPSYTSGHSTFTAAAADVLSYLFPAGRTEFERLRDEASISRLYAGIHYRSDIDVGKQHGRRIGGYTVRFAQTDGADVPLRTTATAKTK
jgi:membrane-associated phospholipid phosphatase